jgi:hypothetical protein
MSKVTRATPRNKSRRWEAAMGGDRLSPIQKLLAGERNTLAALPEDHPRRRPTLAQLQFCFLDDNEEVS